MSMLQFGGILCLLRVIISNKGSVYGKMESSLNDSLKENQDVTTFCQTTIDLQNALKSSVENVLKEVTDDIFIKIYKECYQGFEKMDEVRRPSLSGSSIEARKYRKKFNTLVTQSIEETVNDTLLMTMDVNLRELEELKHEQTDTSFVWRPPGNAVKHMIPFDTVSKMEQKKQLESLIEKEREALDLLKARLTQKRLKAKELHDVLQTSLKTIESSVVDVAPKENINGNILA